jgi:hypothetical protein
LGLTDGSEANNHQAPRQSPLVIVNLPVTGWQWQSRHDPRRRHRHHRRLLHRFFPRTAGGFQTTITYNFSLFLFLNHLFPFQTTVSFLLLLRLASPLHLAKHAYPPSVAMAAMAATIQVAGGP